MKKNAATQIIRLGNKREQIVISHIVFEDGFEKERKTAAVAIEPGRDPLEMLETAQSKQWEIFGVKQSNGFFEGAKIVGDLEEEEVEETGENVLQDKK